MRVLHIDTERGLRGGQRQVLWLMEGLAARGVDQALAARRGSELAAAAAKLGVRVEPLPPLPPWIPPSLPGPSWALRRALARFQPDLLHAHSAHAHSLALAAAPPGAHIVVTRRVDFPVKDRAKYADPRIAWIAISTGVAEVLARGGVMPTLIAIVPSGVDIERAQSGTAADRARLRREWGVAEPGPVVGFVGSYVDHKDPLALVEAAPAVLEAAPRARFVLVGEGPLRPALLAKARALGVADAVLLAGWRDDVPACLRAFDLFAMPSKLEGLCTSLVDAQAAGLPCVASNTGGIPDVVEDGANGVLVPPRSPDALGRALAALWKDESRRLRFAAAGPRRAREKFTVDKMVDGTLEAYREVFRREALAAKR